MMWHVEVWFSKHSELSYVYHAYFSLVGWFARYTGLHLHGIINRSRRATTRG